MMGFLMGLLGLADPIAKITSKIIDGKIAARNAQTDQDKIAADERVKGLEFRRDVLLESEKHAGSAFANAVMRICLALPVAVLLWKVLVFDKAFGQWTQGRTDALDENLWKVVAAVIGFYFLYEIVNRVKK